MAALAGLDLDEWQQYALEVGLSERADGKWSAFEVGLVVPRQNGKGAILEARELAGLFLLGEQLIVHSAHEFKTAQEGFRRILQLIESTPDFDRRVMRVTKAHGDEGIELVTGQRLRFVARTGGSGRGFSGDCVVLDEAFNLPEMALGALMPTLSARPNPQLWYASSAVDQTVHPHGVVLARLRERGMAGADGSLAYMEWSVDPGRYWDDPERVACDPAAWAESNPGLGIRISADHVGKEQASMGPRTFATERLSVGDWPSTSVDGWRVLARETWEQVQDREAAPSGRLSFGVDVLPDRSAASIGSSAGDAVELVDQRGGTAWLVARCVELAGRWGGRFVVDGGGPAASVADDLTDAGLEVVRLSGPEVAAACGRMFDAVVAGQVRVRPSVQLDAAVAGAAKKKVGDRFVWHRERSGADVTPLVAVTLAFARGESTGVPQIFRL